MGGDQIAAVDRRRHRRAHLQGGHRHGLAKSGGGQLHLAHVLVGVVLHVAGLVGQVHAGALGKAKGLEVVVKGLDPDPLAQLDEVDVAAVQQGVGQVLGAVAVAPGAVVGLLGHGIGAAAVEGGVVGGVARVHPHGRGDDLKDAAGIVQLGDGLVFPHDVPEIARVVGVGVQDLVAVFVGDKGAVLVFQIDAVQLGLGPDQLFQIRLDGGVVVGGVGGEIRLGSHGQDAPGVDVHHDGAAPVLDGVGGDGLVQVFFHHFLDGGVQRQHQAVAVLGVVGDGAAVRDGVAPGVADGDGPAVRSRQDIVVGFFQPVKAFPVRIGKAQHRRRKRPVGIIALVGAGRGQGPPAAALDGVAVGDVLLDGLLDGVVDLFGQHLVRGVDLAQGRIDGLVLLGIRLGGGVHLVQADAVPRQKAEGQLPADLAAGRGVQGADGGLHFPAGGGVGGGDGLAVVECGGIAGVAPDVPHHAGGGQHLAGGVVDLAPGCLDGGVQQLLVAGVAAVHLAVADLDIVKAVDHDGGAQQHQADGYGQAPFPGLAGDGGRVGVTAEHGPPPAPVDRFFHSLLLPGAPAGASETEKACADARFPGYDRFIRRPPAGPWSAAGTSRRPEGYRSIFPPPTRGGSGRSGRPGGCR